MSMRISVCEFLRIKTGVNWFYVSSGKWMSDRGTHIALRMGKNFQLMERVSETNSYTTIDDLAYFRGESSLDIRAKMQNKKLAKELRSLM